MASAISGIVRLIAVLFLCAVGTVDGLACDCGRSGPPEKSFGQSSAVFRGRVTDLKQMRVEHRGDRSVVVGPSVVFEIIKSWKGVRGTRVEIIGDRGCGFQGFVAGKEFLVYANGPPLAASMCSRTRLAENVDLEMAILDRLAAGGHEETFMRGLRAHLNDPRASVRIEAAAMLGRDVPKEVAIAAIPALVRALDDKELAVRQTVIDTFDAGPWIDVDDNTKVIGRALIRSLSDPEPSVRRSAARVLWKSRFLPETEPALRAALAREQHATKADADVIAAIASTLATIGNRDSKRLVVPLLITQLQSTEPAARENAAQKLGAVGPDAASAVGPLVRTLRDTNEYVRYYTAEALGSIGSRVAIAPLIVLLNDPKSDVSAQAAYALYRIGDDSSVQTLAVPALVRNLDQQSEISHYHAIRILGEMGPSAYRAVPALARALKSAPGYETGSAAEALGKIGPRARLGVPALVDAMTSADDNGRRTIISALESIDERSPRVVQAIQTALGDRDRYVRAAAAGTLVKWRIPRGSQFVAGQIVPYLLTELQSGDVERRRSAANDLGHWGSLAAAAVPGLKKGLADPDRWVRTYSATALGAIGAAAAEAVPQLIPMLDVVEERDEAAEALGQIGPEAAAAVPHLLPLLKDGQPWTRVVSAEALRRIGGRESKAAYAAFATSELPVLVKWLGNRDRPDRGEAARCLVHLAPRSREVLEPLMQALTDSDWLARTKSAEALGALGALAEPAVPRLAGAMADRNAYTRAAASAALERIGSADARRALAESRRVPD